jgi:hypothetical protein
LPCARGILACVDFGPDGLVAFRAPVHRRGPRTRTSPNGRGKKHRAKKHRAKKHRVEKHRARNHRVEKHRAEKHRAKKHRCGKHRAKKHRARFRFGLKFSV